MKSFVWHTPVLYNIIAFSIAAAGAFALSPLFCPLAARLGAMDVPTDSRRMHKRPIPRIGGLAVFIGFLLSVSIFDNNVALLSGALVIVSIGIVDDIYRISAYQKLIFQMIAAAVAISFGARAPIADGFISTAFSLAWLVVLPNAFNLIDGLDGLCARASLFAALALFAMSGSVAAVALAGAIVGFLPFNLRPAKIFLGDTGSLFVGFTLGVISLGSITTAKSFISMLFVFALPLADTAYAFFRRISKGKNPFAPDREHFHHKLVDRGFSHKEASLLLSLVSLALCAIATAM